MKIDMRAVKPYGDTINDGKVQISFTLPLKAGREAEEAARILAYKMGLEEVDIVEIKDLGEGFCFFILYGKLSRSVDATTIKAAKIDTNTMDYYEINDFIKKEIGRKVIVVGACTGSDAHTVGLDSILNMKGFAGEYGLERYPEFNVYNLGSQVPNEKLIIKAVETGADEIGRASCRERV